MDKVALLCEKDSEMMQEFSRRALERLTGHSLFSIHLPFLSDYLEANVMKEVEKDRLIIEHAAGAFAAGVSSSALDVDDIFEKTKTVDRAFVSRLLIPSLAITVKYEDIAGVRKLRIARLTRTVYDLLAGWRDASSIAEAVKLTYCEQEFREVILDVLHLYSLETRLLGRSIRFFPPFNRALNQLAETLFETMEKAAVEMSIAYAKKVYGQEPIPCPSLI